MEKPKEINIKNKKIENQENKIKNKHYLKWGWMNQQKDYSTIL